jgi:hypothetical protein
MATTILFSGSSAMSGRYSSVLCVDMSITSSAIVIVGADAGQPVATDLRRAMDVAPSSRCRAGDAPGWSCHRVGSVGTTGTGRDARRRVPIFEEGLPKLPAADRRP